MNDRALDRLFRRFAARHDGVALAAVFDATWKELFDVACHLNRDAAQAEDLVQTTFVTAIGKAKEYDGSTPLRGWLYGILWREAAKSRRESARRVDPARLSERREPEPIDGLLAREVPAAVERALGELPAQYREVLEPLLRDGRPPEEIAQRLQRSPGTIRSQIHRGLERLRRLLPRDLAPLPALIAVRGQSQVRAEILRAAGFSPAIAAGASALILKASLGTIVMSKLTLAGLAAALVAAATWYAYAPPPARGPRAPTDATGGRRAHEARESASEPAPRLSTGSSDGAEAPTRVSADESVAISATDPASPEDDVQYWLARFNVHPDDWRYGWSVTRELARLEPERALAILRGVWPHLSVPVREQALKPFVFDGGTPIALQVLHLGATDPALSVQARAFGYLRDYAFQDFANDYQAYLAWQAEFRERPVAQVLSENAKRFVGELNTLAPAALAERMRALDKLDLRAGEGAGLDLARTMRDAGALDVLATCLQRGDEDAQVRALSWSSSLKADEAWLRAWVAPRIEPTRSPRELDATFEALSRAECRWAVPAIEDYLRRASEAPPRSEAELSSGAAPAVAFQSTRSAARALAEIGDPAAIPVLIETLLHDRSGRLDRDIGNGALAKLTGVTWQPGYDGEWWLRWWEKNAERLPPHVRAMNIRR